MRWNLLLIVTLLSIVLLTFCACNEASDEGTGLAPGANRTSGDTGSGSGGGGDNTSTDDVFDDE